MYCRSEISINQASKSFGFEAFLYFNFNRAPCVHPLFVPVPIYAEIRQEWHLHILKTHARNAELF